MSELDSAYVKAMRETIEYHSRIRGKVDSAYAKAMRGTIEYHIKDGIEACRQGDVAQAEHNFHEIRDHLRAQELRDLYLEYLESRATVSDPHPLSYRAFITSMKADD